MKKTTKKTTRKTSTTKSTKVKEQAVVNPRQHLIEKAYHLLPDGFSWKYYLRLNPDVEKITGQNEEAVIAHYLKFGKQEGRAYKDKTIYIKPRNGLGNRIININDMYVFAIDHGFSSIKVCWTSTEGFSDEKFEELFDIDNIPSNISFISEKEYDEACAQHLKLNDFVQQDPKTFQYVFNTNSDNLLEKIKNNTFCYDDWSSIIWIFDKQLWQNMRERNDFIAHLRPNTHLQKIIDDASKNFHSDVVGVHIRRGDAARSDFGNQYLRSSDDAFLEEINKHVGMKSGYQQFFLATDCKRTEEYILKKSPPYAQIITHDKKNFVDDSISMDENKPNQKDAIIDLFLLSKTSAILGNYWSTFDDLASRIGNIPCRKINSTQENVVVNTDPISVLVGVKNRQKALHISLNSWLQHDLIKQIVIVDWSSDVDLSYLESWDPRVKVVRVENKKKYHVAEALNTGIPYLHNNKILKLDVDYIINPYFDLAEITNINENEFLAGNWSQYKEDNNLGFIENLHGLVCVYKKNLIKINGYNENIKEYGWEDSDLYERLELAGLQPKNLNFAHNHVPMFHIPHKNNHRTQHYEDKDVYRTLLKNQAIAKQDIQENMALAKNYTGIQKIIKICDYVQSEDLKAFDNNLESIGLLITGTELDDGSYENFVQRISDYTPRNYLTRKTPFNIFCKGIDAESIDIRKLKKIFDEVNIHPINIPHSLDYYYKYDPNTIHYGIYGKKSGPNFAFFEAIKKSEIYNTTLLLECDCYFGEDWLRRIAHYTNNYGGFLISGAVYLGNYEADKKIHDTINTHINGGICLYATGNNFFKKYIQFCRDKMPEIVRKSNMGDIAYDFGIKIMIDDYYNDATLLQEREFFQFIRQKYVVNSLIGNFSNKSCEYMTLEEIQSKYNFALLHRK